jgi:serine/threonine protein phosphatase 1
MIAAMPDPILPAVTTSAWQDLPGGHSVPRPVFAIGDVHGCDRHLEALHGAARDSITAERLSRPLVIRLGDYIDRGPDTPRALDLVRDGLGLPGVEEINLLGNHEQLLLNALLAEDREIAGHAARVWLGNGGRALCLHLGIHPELAEAGQLRLLRPRLQDILGQGRIDLLLSLRTAVALEGGLVFVHAGLNPGIDPDRFLDQGWRDYGLRTGAMSPYWIRDEFLHWPRPLPGNRLVVHGHTIEKTAPAVLGHRIGLDAGCVRTGRLLMAEFRHGRFRTHAAISAPPEAARPSSG